MVLPHRNLGANKGHPGLDEPTLSILDEPTLYLWSGAPRIRHGPSASRRAATVPGGVCRVRLGLAGVAGADRDGPDRRGELAADLGRDGPRERGVEGPAAGRCGDGRPGP